MGAIVKFVGIIFAALIIAAIALLIGFALILRLSYPPQPKLGYTGDWRTYSVLGTEERPLPIATNIWTDYSQWKPKNEHALKMYLAHLGGASRQKNFQSYQSRGDTPMGAQDYTHVSFNYDDPYYGPLTITWMLRGKHITDLLKFDDTFRFYQLAPYGEPNGFPPTLAIHGIEGIRPEFSHPQNTNTYVLSPKELAEIKQAHQPFKLNVPAQ